MASKKSLLQNLKGQKVFIYPNGDGGTIDIHVSKNGTDIITDVGDDFFEAQVRGSRKNYYSIDHLRVIEMVN